MTAFDWLATPGGLAFAQAVTLLLVAITAYLNWRIHQVVVPQNGKHPNDQEQD